MNKAEQIAKALIEEYMSNDSDSDRNLWRAKENALIHVRNILEMDLPLEENSTDEFYDLWQQVKTILESN